MMSPHPDVDPAQTPRGALGTLGRSRIYVNAYALVLNQVLSAGLGFVYWMLAARLYGVEVVGASSATISTLLLVSGVAQLGLGGGMNRFVPRAGSGTRRLIVGAYVVTVASAGALGLLALWLVRTADSGSLPGIGNTAPALAVLATVLWSVFAFQDGVLIGLRKSTWVLIENTLYNVLKTGLLVAGVWALGDAGIVGSWFIPTPFVIALVAWVVFARFLRAPLEPAKPGVDEPTLKEVAFSVTGDHAGSMVAEAAVRALPLMVVAVLGTAENAFFYQAWLVATAITLVADGMANSYSAEASGDRGNITAYSRGILRHMAAFLVPASLVVGVAAPLVLSLFGPEYAQRGSAVLRWLAIGAIPATFAVWHLAYSRVVGHIRTVFVLQTTRAVILLALSYAMLPSFGIEAVGVAWLVANTAVAIYGLFDARGVLWPADDGAAFVVSSPASPSATGTAEPLRTDAAAGGGPTLRRVLVIAPHLDDAAMSCGAGIRHLVDAGAEVTVVTVCSQDEEQGAELSALAQRNLRSWGLAERPFEARRAEDACAMRVLGASARYLGLKDAFYRRTAAGGFAYAQSVLVPPEASDAAAFARDLARELRPVLGEGGDARVLCPAGVGGHVDHVLVRRFVEEAVDAARIVYYEEYPYSSRRGMAASGEGPVGPARPRIVFAPTARELEARIDAVTCYGSQLRGLFPTTVERVTEVLSARLPVLGGAFARPPRVARSAERARRTIVADVARVGGEVYWLGDPTASNPFGG